MTRKWATIVPFLSVTLAAGLGVACGEKRETDQPLSPAQQLMLDNGCVACHGPNGEGGVGASWQGLYLSEVALVDGSTVIADETYLFESIRNPAAEQVKGYGPMPPNSLDDAEVQLIIDFIKSLQT